VIANFYTSQTLCEPYIVGSDTEKRLSLQSVHQKTREDLGQSGFNTGELTHLAFFARVIIQDIIVQD